MMYSDDEYTNVIYEASSGESVYIRIHETPTNTEVKVPEDIKVIWDFSDGATKSITGNNSVEHTWREEGNYTVSAVVMYPAGAVVAKGTINVVSSGIVEKICGTGCCLIFFGFFVLVAWLIVRMINKKVQRREIALAVPWEWSDILRLGVLLSIIIFPLFFIFIIFVPITIVLWFLGALITVGLMKFAIKILGKKLGFLMKTQYYVIEKPAPAPVVKEISKSGYYIDRVNLALSFSMPPTLLCFALMGFFISVPSDVNDVTLYLTENTEVVILLITITILCSFLIVPIRVIADSSLVVFDRTGKRIEYIGAAIARLIEPIAGMGALTSFITNFWSKIWISGVTMVLFIFWIYIIWGFVSIVTFLTAYFYVPRHPIYVQRVNNFLKEAGLLHLAIKEIDAVQFRIEPTLPTEEIIRIYGEQNLGYSTSPAVNPPASNTAGPPNPVQTTASQCISTPPPPQPPRPPNA